MAEVFLVYLGKGNTFDEGVYVEHMTVEAAYSSIDLAMEHASKWKENWLNDMTYCPWCHFENYEDVEYLYDGDTAVVYSVREYIDYDEDDDCGNDFNRYYCKVRRITVLDKCKEL